MAKTYTLDMLAKEMQDIAKTMQYAHESDRDAIIQRMDALALKSAQLQGDEAEKLRMQLDAVADKFVGAQENGFSKLSDELKDSVSSVLDDLNTLKAGQQSILAGQQSILSGQDNWGNRILQAVQNVGGAVASHVIVAEAIVAAIIGIIVGILVKINAPKVMEQIYDENLTPIGVVPKYTAFEQWGLAVCFSVLAAIIVFSVSYGISKLIERSRTS